MKPRRRGVRRPGRTARYLALHRRDNLRDRPSVPHHEQSMPLEFRRYAGRALLPLLTFTGKKIPEQRRVAMHCLHTAVLAGLAGATVADTRRKTQPGVRLRTRAWDALADAGLVVLQKGTEASGKVTRYLATGRLLAHFRDWPLEHYINIELGRNTIMPDNSIWDALVVLRERKKDGGKVLPMPQGELDTCHGGVSVGAYVEGVEDDIEFINRANLRHTWTAYKELEDGRLRAFQPNVCLKQLHAGRLMAYARLYTWDAASAQNLPERERRLMEIDGEPVAELDYAGHNLRLLYHILRIDPGQDDIYRPEQVLPTACGDVRTRKAARDFVKTATNVMLNTTTRHGAVMGVRGLLYTEKDSPVWAALLRREGIKARQVVDRIRAAHPEVAHRFFTTVGADLQTVDGMIMKNILMVFAKSGRPALGIHDSVVCRVSDAGFAEAMMEIQHHALLGFRPVVRRVF